MAMQIHLPEKLNAIAKARASERGFKSVDAYVKMLIRDDASAAISEDVESALLKSLASPSRPIAPEFWAEKRRGLKQSHRRAKAG